MRIRNLFHRRSTVPTTREPAGADPKFVHELRALRENDLVSIAAELDLDLLNQEHRAAAEEILQLRLVVAEDLDHFDQRIERLLDEWQPGWWEETPVVPLSDFAEVHALIDEDVTV